MRLFGFDRESRRVLRLTADDLLAMFDANRSASTPLRASHAVEGTAEAEADYDLIGYVDGDRRRKRTANVELNQRPSTKEH